MRTGPNRARLAATHRGARTAILFALLFTATAHAQPPTLAAREEATLRAAAERVAESVVQIRTIGGLDTVGRTLLPDGPTTGLVISADGYIVSSAFNFVQQPSSILVTFASGKQVPAELVATDHSRMIVLLKAAGVADLPVPELVQAGETRVGQWAIAVGRTFRPDRTNVSIGIVSALNRMYGKVLQTDADVSMANYGGPLVDVRGRVLGVIVPMAPQSPQGASEVAGVEWYDSGIGFAVPLDAIGDRLEQMKRGDDLYAGVLGIGMAPKNPHSASAELAAVRPDSPAGKAGLKKGDRVVQFDDKPIRTQTDLRFALGTRYGGDSVKIIVERGEERLERTITLAGKLPAFRHAFLGILPLRPAAEQTADAGTNADERNGNGEAEDETADGDGEEKTEVEKPAMEEKAATAGGIVVRMVYPGGPAETAGVRAGDRVMKVGDAPVTAIETAIGELNNIAPGSEVVVQIERDSKSIELKLSAAELPTSVPSELPPAYAPAEGTPNAAEPAKGETRELKLPEFTQECKVYVPAEQTGGPAPGMLLWLHDAGKADADAVIRGWQSICDRDRLVLVVPTAAEASGWDRTEVEYLGRLLLRVVNQYKVDRHRIVVAGSGAGGAMAWSLGFSGRELIRGVAVSGAPLPRRITVPPNEPSQRLAIFSALPGDKEAAILHAQGLQKCAEAGYPVSTIPLAENGSELTSTDREVIACWIDTLDRF